MFQRVVLVLGLSFVAVGADLPRPADPLFSGLATFDNGLVVRYATTAATPVTELNLGGWAAGEVISDAQPSRTPGVETQRLQRYFIDAARNIYFGYTLRVSRPNLIIPAGSRDVRPYQVWIEPLSLTVRDLPERFRKPQLRRADLRAYPPSRRVGYFDSIEIDLTPASRGRADDAGLHLREILRFAPTGTRSLPLGQ